MEPGETTVRRWWVVPPRALRGPVALVYTLVFVAIFIAAAITLDIALSMCNLGPCDATAQWALVLPLWWPAFLWGPNVVILPLALLWLLFLTWMVSRVAIVLWLRYG